MQTTVYLVELMPYLNQTKPEQPVFEHRAPNHLVSFLDQLAPSCHIVLVDPNIEYVYPYDACLEMWNNIKHLTTTNFLGTWDDYLASLAPSEQIMKNTESRLFLVGGPEKFASLPEVANFLQVPVGGHHLMMWGDFRELRWMPDVFNDNYTPPMNPTRLKITYQPSDIEYLYTEFVEIYDKYRLAGFDRRPDYPIQYADFNSWEYNMEGIFMSCFILGRGLRSRIYTLDNQITGPSRDAQALFFTSAPYRQKIFLDLQGLHEGFKPNQVHSRVQL